MPGTGAGRLTLSDRLSQGWSTVTQGHNFQGTVVLCGGYKHPQTHTNRAKNSSRSAWPHGERSQVGDGGTPPPHTHTHTGSQPHTQTQAGTALCPWVYIQVHSCTQTCLGSDVLGHPFIASHVERGCDVTERSPPGPWYGGRRDHLS